MSNDGVLAGLLEEVAERQMRAAATREAEGATYAPEFNPIRFCQTNEVGISEIIRWMLDPSETHVQGVAFLEAFFDIFGTDVKGRVASATCAHTEV